MFLLLFAWGIVDFLICLSVADCTSHRSGLMMCLCFVHGSRVGITLVDVYLAFYSWNLPATLVAADMPRPVT